MPEQQLPGWNIGWELPDEREEPRYYSIVVERRNDAFPADRDGTPRVSVTRMDNGFAITINYSPKFSDTNQDHFETDLDWHTLSGELDLKVTCKIKRTENNTHTQTIVLRGGGGGGPEGRVRPKNVKILSMSSRRRGQKRMLPIPSGKKRG